MNEPVRIRAASLFASLANPTRLRIVELLIAEPLSVNEICKRLNIGQSATSQNLAVLVRSGLLECEPHGNMRVYKVRGPRIGNIITMIEEFCTIHSLYGEPEEALRDTSSAEVEA
jgi:DNA-binding transcriptional ArsR family regulator